jgi:hypothetical protein
MSIFSTIKEQSEINIKAILQNELRLECQQPKKTSKLDISLWLIELKSIETYYHHVHTWEAFI